MLRSAPLVVTQLGRAFHVSLHSPDGVCARYLIANVRGLPELLKPVAEMHALSAEFADGYEGSASAGSDVGALLEQQARRLDMAMYRLTGPMFAEELARVESKVYTYVAENRVRLESFFVVYDRLRHRHITRSQFFRALNAAMNNTQLALNSVTPAISIKNIDFEGGITAKILDLFKVRRRGARVRPNTF